METLLQLGDKIRRRDVRSSGREELAQKTKRGAIEQMSRGDGGTVTGGGADAQQHKGQI